MEAVFRYDAFISYSHAADDLLAPAIHRALHQIARPRYRIRALRVYRDKTTLEITASLWPTIERALADSRYLILLASPDAAASPWVTKEVQWWLDHRSIDTLLIAVTDGQFAWDAAGGDFDWDATTALPTILAGRFPHEPLCADFRFARTTDQLSQRHGHFRTEAVRLASAVHGRPMDDLESEDIRLDRARRRRRRVVRFILAMLTVTVTVLGGVAWVQRDSARRNANLAYDRLASLLASQSTTSTASLRDPQRALLLALTAADMRATEATRTALYEALQAQPYLDRILTGHSADKFFSSSPSASSGISDLEYDKETGDLFSAGDDGKIIRWKPATGRRQVLGTPHYLNRGGIQDLALSRDGARLASTGVGNSAVWDLATGMPSLGPGGRLDGQLVAFDASGRLGLLTCPTSCVSGGVEFTVWDPATWRRVWSLRYPRYVMATTMSGTVLAGSGCLQDGAIGNDTCAQGFIQLWDTSTGKAIGGPLVAGGKEIMAVDFSADGSRILAGTRGGQIQLWDVANRRLSASWQGHRGMVRAVRFSPDGAHVATAGQDGRATVWNASDLRARPRTFSAYDSPVTALAFSPDGQQLATGNQLNVITLWSLGIDTHTGSSFHVADSEPRSVAVSPDGKNIVLGGGDGIVTVVDRQTRQTTKRFAVAPVCPHSLEQFKGPYHPCYLNVLKFSPDGRVLLAASSSGNIARWDTSTWTALGDPLDAAVPCRSLICDGRTLTAKGLAFSPDLGTVAVGANGQIWVWDLNARKLRHTLPAHDDVTTLAVSSDGQLLAAGGKDKTILLWDLRDGHRVGDPMRHEGEITALAFQPKHHRLASNGTDNTVRLWNTDAQRQVAALRNDSANYEPGLAFSPDGTYLATTTTNYRLALWDAATLAAFPRFTEPASIMAITFDPVRPELISVAKGSGSHAPTSVTTRGYDLAEWQHRACHIVPRNLDYHLIETYTLGKTQVCPDVAVDGSVVRHWLDVAQSRLNTKDASGTSSAYREATRLARLDDNDDPELANLVCLHGAVSRYPREVLPACDHAVALSPDSGPIRNSRAIARSLAGDRTGAVADLEFFLDWANNSGLFNPTTIRFSVGTLDDQAVPKRQAWIAELRRDANPFTATELAAAWMEYLQDQGGNTYQTCPVEVGGRVEWVQRPTGC
ncbi:TIR domain-containing protein [Phytohabitans houttuyneae]|uniref:TIR domain-containing protein n=1 Tax=Phytohabitans houttuyneae TaxID=1076126 RepID=A0A6V8K6N8_9ACTN|nr:TIR domain-containing protein [Phytohabitans houttuyneae]GFJ77417.1 hypothetical protein Phou_015970 [Phytohabitans houttuyneae]